MEATVKILDWVELPTLELIPIRHQGAVLRLPYLKSRLGEAQAQVEAFREKYAIMLAELREQGLPDDATYEMHEDFIEWEYWSEVAQKTRAALKNIEMILARIEENTSVGPG